MGFFLFLLVNATVFLRPVELVESWREVKIYEPLILACLACSFLDLMALFTSASERRQPLTLLIIALLPIIFLSNAANVSFDDAFENAFEYFKIIVYFLLLLALVNTPQRMRIFLGWIALCATAITLLAVLQYHGVITLNTLKPMADIRGDGFVHEQIFNRLRGTGLFDDPNDFGSLVVVAVILCLYWLIDGYKSLLPRLLWLAPLGLVLYALVLTQSRGAMLAMLLGVMALLWYRFKPGYALALMAMVVPLVLVVFAARDTGFQGDDTSQTRFQLWQSGLELLKESPVLGVGMYQFWKRNDGLVAHNSFLHCYGELGFLGGTLFLGAYFFAIYFLARVGSRKVAILDPLVRQLNPYILATVVGYTAAIMSISRSYVVPTYLVLGLAAAQLRMVSTYPQVAFTGPQAHLVRRLACASIGFLALVYVTCRLLVRYS